MSMVRFLELATVPDERFRFAVIAARHDGRWLFVRHRLRDTWEVPGGHREAGETLEEAAARELYEETGAVEYALLPVCAYAVEGDDGAATFGGLYFAEVKALDDLPQSEIAEVRAFDCLPKELTYPQIQPMIYEKVRQFLDNSK